MVRNYKKKEPKYSSEVLQKAIDEVIIEIIIIVIIMT